MTALLEFDQATLNWAGPGHGVGVLLQDGGVLDDPADPAHAEIAARHLVGPTAVVDELLARVADPAGLVVSLTVTDVPGRPGPHTVRGVHVVGARTVGRSHTAAGMTVADGAAFTVRKTVVRLGFDGEDVSPTHVVSG